MKIYHYHPATGVFLGESEADKCPVSGVDLIPAYATAEAPPTAGENQYVAWENGAWVVRDVPQPEPEPEPTTDELWASLRAERDRRLKAQDITDRLDRFRNQRDGSIQTTDTAEWFQAALLYLQELRDMPENTVDPAAPAWPVPPS